MKNDTQEKLNKLTELLKEKDKIEQEIEKLLSPQKVVALPHGFSLNDEIIRVVEDFANKEDGTITSKKIFDKLNEKFPNYGIQRAKVNIALTYLKSDYKKLLESVGRGVYKKRKE
jgi:hypothetical protein